MVHQHLHLGSNDQSLTAVGVGWVGVGLVFFFKNVSRETTFWGLMYRRYLNGVGGGNKNLLTEVEEESFTPIPIKNWVIKDSHTWMSR